MTNITIVGAGLMGTAVAYPLSDNGHNIRLVGTHLDREIIKSCKDNGYHPRLKRNLPSSVIPYFYEEIVNGMEGAEIVVSGVNSLGVHWIGKAISPYLHPGQSVIAITKGLEVDSAGELKILPDVLASEIPAPLRDQVTFAAVGGPCIAGELAGRRQSCVVFGSRNADAVEKLAKTFRTSYYHIWTTTDLVGLEISAALKNAYALSVGMVLGMLDKAGGVDYAGAYMHNMAAAVFAQAGCEMEKILELFGATKKFSLILPGVGDLYVTSVGGRTVRLGTLIGSGHDYLSARRIMEGETLEAAEIVKAMGQALPKLVAGGNLKSDDMPLMKKLIEVVVDNCTPELPMDHFFGGEGWI